MCVSLLSELEHQHHPDAVLVGSGQFEIVEASDILHAEHLEYVAHSGHNLNVWPVAVHYVCPVGKLHQDVAAGVAGVKRVVLP